jgi:hypothetical protein
MELAAAAGIGCEVGDYTLPQLYNAEESFVPARWAASPRSCPSTAAPSAMAPPAR